jgi:hypothetical protein
MKKVLLIVMSMVLVLGMLSGCKPSTVSNDANSKDADTIRVGLNYRRSSNVWSGISRWN